MKKRIFDILMSTVLLVSFFVPIVLIIIIIKMTSKGPAIHWSKRIGIDNKIFLMPKFRSMFIETPQVATHLLANSEVFITPFGAFLRKTSLDELPQLLAVIKGDMSLVGPRPALFNQDDLVRLRSKFGIEKLRPGITGWAQINGRDDLSIADKVNFDKEYLVNYNLLLDFKILFLTVFRVLQSKGVRH